MSEKIIGQSDVVKEISKILDIFVASNAKIRPHFILAGSSGSVKVILLNLFVKKKIFRWLKLMLHKLQRKEQVVIH